MASEVNYTSFRAGYFVYGKDADNLDYEVRVSFHPSPMGYPGIPEFWRVKEIHDHIIARTSDAVAAV